MLNPAWHRRLRLARRGVGYALAVGLVLMALLAGVVSQLLPLAERHPDRIAAWLGERIGRPVAFDRVETRWTRRGPLLQLDNLRLGEGDRAIRIGDAEMLVSQYAGLLPGGSFTELRLRGLELTLERSDDGRWQVRGLPGDATAGSDPFASLEGLGELQVIGGKLSIVAPSLQIDTQLPRIDLRLRVDGDRVRIGMRAWMRAGRSPLQAAFDFGRKRGDGRGHVLARQADLEAWSPLLHVAGVAAEAGRGMGEAWATLHDHRVTAVVVDATLDGVTLRGAALVAGQIPRAHFQRVQAFARWQAVAGGWRVDAPRLRIGEGGAIRILDGLLFAGGDRKALLASNIDAGPLLQVAALSDRMPPRLRQWIGVAKPQATARDLVFAASHGALRASGRLDHIGFAPVADAPGLTGLAGTLHADSHGFAFELDPDAPFRFDWPRGFGVAHPASLTGIVAGWREGAGWRIDTRELRVRGPDFGLDVRGGLWFQGDGTLPWIDLATQVSPTQLATAKGFWIHHKMAPAALHWLDTALVAGRLEQGRALISGDLDDWPFRAGDHAPAKGRFQANARIVDGTLKFQPDWPAIEHVDGDIEFVADGFKVAGKGVLAGVGIRHFDAGIERFGHAPLTVAAQGGGDASQLLQLLRQSPLQKKYAETLDNLVAKGLASVTFRLDLPLHHDHAAAKLDGDVVLVGATLSERRWKLAFDDVRGRAHYDGSGFAAEGLAVRLEGSPARLTLRAGDNTRDRRQAFEAELDGNLQAERLLQRVPELSWLQGRASGRSPWNALVTIPGAAAGRAAPARLQLRSSLLGTALDLPAPLRKPANASLPTTIETTLPLGEGEVRVVLGRRLALRARSNTSTGVRVVLGSDTVTEPPPASGLIVTGRTDVFDALDWATVARGGTPAPGRAGASGATLPLRRIDIVAARLNLLGASFADTRMQLVRTTDAMQLQLQGDAIAGNVRIPDAADALVSGRFERVHWRALPGIAVTTANTAGPATDPSKLPPIAFDIADLKVSDASLGVASLRTQPVPAGMRITRLQSRSRQQRIDASGDWLGRGDNTRTRLDVGVDSDDFGALLAGLGYGGQLGHGRGQAKLTLGWAGGPADFSLLSLDGNLALDIRDGQLVELEPGAGRVLGLLSVAQLPRRLTLDFRDFFNKGFAFDKLEGHVRIGSGKASSEDLVMAGPAAEIHIRGTADLRQQTFDQSIDVLPRAGNLLTAVGAIAAGPVGAAIGAAANAMLRKPLGQMASKSYRVTGPWKEPIVEVLERHPAVPAPAMPPATAPPIAEPPATAPMALPEPAKG
ncbi:MAG: YhdP family protein [Luteimonas sp.]